MPSVRSCSILRLSASTSPSPKRSTSCSESLDSFASMPRSMTTTVPKYNTAEITASVATTSTPYPRARRNATLPSSLLIDAQHVADAAHRMQQRRRELLVDLLPQSTDLHVDGIRLRIEVIVPDRLEQHGARDHLPLMANEILEQSKLARLQRDGLVGPLRATAPQIELQVCDLQLRGIFFHAGPAQERLNACQELGEREGFRQVVVAAALKSPHALIEAGEGAEHENGRRLPERPQGTDDRESLDVSREHPVEDDDVPALGRRQVETIHAIARPLHHEAGLSETIADVAGGIRVVFDQETLHPQPLPSRVYG